MRKIIGTVTIGQSPRVDMIPEISEILGPGIEIKESGALDDLSREEIDRLAPEEGDYVLVSRLRDGTSVQMAERHVLPLVEAKIEAHFNNGIPIVLLLCTGEFPEFEGGLLVSPQKILYNAVSAIAAGRRIGVLTPSAEQVAQSKKRWSTLSSEVEVAPASPYVNGPEAVEKAAHKLKEAGCELTILDCMGYTKEMQNIVREITGKPAILGRGIAAHTLSELLG